MEINDIFSLGELFEEVQMKEVYPDGKTFVDCIPKEDLSSIRQRYEAEKNNPSFDLTAFTHEHFTEPKAIASDYKSDTSISLEKHIEALWDVLTRQPEASKNDSLIPLPHEYIVPGGRFREIYYWDSFFTMLGLQVSNRVDMIQNMVDNFSYLIDEVGYIPNGNRIYFMSRSQPPFYACMVKLLSEIKGQKIIADYLPQLEKEYAFWIDGSDALDKNDASINRIVLMPNGSVLNHYWDAKDTPRPEAYQKELELSLSSSQKNILYRHLRAACESGWDFSSRWFKDKSDFSTIHTGDIIPVDLNCLLYNLEVVIGEAHSFAGNETLAEKYLALAERRKDAINVYCWNEEKQFYFDYDYVAASQTDSYTLAATFPLYFKIASDEQANAVAQKIENDLLKHGGLTSTTEITDQQWDSPNGWAPLQWIAIMGLDNYKHHALAKDIAQRWMNINERVYKETGKMMEKYNVIETGITAGGGEYPSQDGFGWSNGVYLALKQWMK